jgi:deoxyribonuclease V
LWPSATDELVAVQLSLAAEAPEPWTFRERCLIAGCWTCFPLGATGPGAAGEPAWAASVVTRAGRVVDRHVLTGRTGAAYQPGLLALRTGPLLQDVVRRLDPQPDVLLVDATGRDHPRRAGLALHIGAALGVPTVGVTHRPLLATGTWPEDSALATAPLVIDSEVVASWLRTRPGSRPIVVHPAWRTDTRAALEVVVAALGGRRTPEPLRLARQAARRARASTRELG